MEYPSMGMEFLQNHIALSSSNDINEICRPLAKLGITYFSFVRTFKDGSHIRLSNNADWTKHYYRRGFYNVVINQVPNAEGNILWSCIDRYPLFHDASEYFDVDNGMVMVFSFNDVVERYFFGAKRENKKVNSMYVNQVDLFKRFVLYFKEVAKPLIDMADSSRIVVPLEMIDIEDNEFCNNENVKEFLDEIKIHKVCIRSNGEDVLININEAKILSLMKRGFTAKEISDEIGLTKKTIDHYRDKLKEKLNLYTARNLLTLVNCNSLIDLNLLGWDPL